MASSKAKMAIWAVPLLAVVGFGGFGAINFSGNLRSIGTVGDTDISANEYALALRNALRAQAAENGQAVTMEQARQSGLADAVLTQVVTQAALNDETARLDISVGDETVVQELRNVSTFQGPDGQFSRDAYNLALQSAGLRDSDYEDDIRRESARSLLQAAVLSGTALPDTYVNTLMSYAGETRDFTWARLTRGSFDTGLPDPSDEELAAWYEDNLAQFTLPETRQITYAWLTPDMIVDTVEVSEDDLRAAYDERSDEFNMPERRLVERLVFANEAEAQDARERVESGESDFETLIADRGLEVADTDMGDQTRANLGDAAEAVFAAEPGVIVGPEWSPLGPALYRVNGVLAAQETTFEEAEPDLRDALVLDSARRAIDAMAQSLDDELAGGVTLEELAETTDMQLGQIGFTSGSSEGIAGYEVFRAEASEVSESDYPAISSLGDGGIFAMRLDEVQAPAPQPLEDVRDAARQGWETQAATDALVEQAQSLAERIDTGTSFEDVGLAPQTEQALTRDARVEGLPPSLLTEVFQLEPGRTAVLPGMGEALVLRLDAVNPVDLDGEQAQVLSGLLRDQAANAVAQDLFRALNTEIQSRAGVTVDMQSVAAIQSTLQ